MMLQNKIKQNSLKRLYIPYIFRILAIGGSVSGKTNALSNLIKYKDDYDYDIIEKKLLKC